MKRILKLTAVICLILSSCSIEQEDLAFKLESDFYHQVHEIVENPIIYDGLNPENINPYDFELIKNQTSAEGARSQSVLTEALPQELISVSDAFQKTVRVLIAKRKSTKPENFSKLAYAVELEVINSDLSNLKKDFLLKELAALKALSSLELGEMNNGRIMCDSQFECDVLGCMEGKAEAAFGPDNNWIDLAVNIYSLPVAFPSWWASCTWDAAFK